MAPASTARYEVAEQFLAPLLNAVRDAVKEGTWARSTAAKKASRRCVAAWRRWLGRSPGTPLEPTGLREQRLVHEELAELTALTCGQALASLEQPVAGVEEVGATAGLAGTSGALGMLAAKLEDLVKAGWDLGEYE